MRDGSSLGQSWQASLPEYLWRSSLAKEITGSGF